MKKIQNNKELFRPIISKYKHLLIQLPEKDRTILEMRYGFIDGIERTQKYIGEIYGVGPHRIRQLEARGHHRILKLIGNLEENELPEDTLTYVRYIR